MLFLYSFGVFITIQGRNNKVPHEKIYLVIQLRFEKKTISNFTQLMNFCGLAQDIHWLPMKQSIQLKPSFGAEKSMQ